MRQIFIRMRIVTLVLFMAVVGCAVPRAGILLPDGSTVYEIYPRVEFIDDERRAVPVEHFPKDMKLIFPSISGQIDGVFASAPLQIVHVTNGSEFRLDLGGMTRSIHDASKTFIKNIITRGLSIVPPSTKLARIATLAVDANTGKSIGGPVLFIPSREIT